MRPPSSQLSLSERILVLLEKQHMLTIPQILDSLAKQNISVNKTSVYRALENLVGQDQVTRQSLGTNDIWYERQEHAYHHDHLVCTTCGNVDSLPCAVKVKNLPKNFAVSYHNLTIYGQCQKCQKVASRL